MITELVRMPSPKNRTPSMSVPWVTPVAGAWVWPSGESGIGVGVEWFDDGDAALRGRTVKLELSDGTRIEADEVSSRDETPSIFNILKLGHVAYRVLDVQQIVKFYSEVLGFRVSDWRGDFFVFMRCNTDHHTLNFIIDEKPQLHHIAFEVLDWAEIHKAVDYLAHNKVHLVWGPGRHVIGHNVATYHRNADLVRVEIFTEMDQMKDEDLGYFDPRPWHQEFPLYPKMHGPETLRNYWGFGSERVIQGYQTNELPKYEAIRG